MKKIKSLISIFEHRLSSTESRTPRNTPFTHHHAEGEIVLVGVYVGEEVGSGLMICWTCKQFETVWFGSNIIDFRGIKAHFGQEWCGR